MLLQGKAQQELITNWIKVARRKWGHKPDTWVKEKARGKGHRGKGHRRYRLRLLNLLLRSRAGNNSLTLVFQTLILLSTSSQILAYEGLLASTKCMFFSWKNVLLAIANCGKYSPSQLCKHVFCSHGYIHQFPIFKWNGEKIWIKINEKEKLLSIKVNNQFQIAILTSKGT